MSQTTVNLEERSGRQRAAPRAGGFALPRLARAIVEGFPRMLGAMLLWAASLKIWDESGVARVLEFAGVPKTLIFPTVSLIIAIESAVGLLLLLRPKVAAILDAAMVLLTLYTAQLLYLATSSEAPNCTCLAAWEAYRSARLGNLMGIGRNVCLIVPLLWVRARVTRT